MTYNQTSINKVGKFIYNHLGDHLTNIECGNYEFLTDDQGENYISIYRLCSNSNIDWILVLQVPVWNYLNSLVISALITSLISIIIAILSIIGGVVFSLQIVKPFNRLVYQFEQISQMKLEQDTESFSRFSEVSSLQYHLSMMIKRINMYRAFIPSHLLSQLENNVVDSNNKDTKQNQMHGDNHSVSSSSAASASKESKYSLMAVGSKKHNQSTTSNRLDLYSNHSNQNQQSSSTRSKPSAAAVSIFQLGISERKIVSAILYLDGFLKLCQEREENEIVIFLSEIFKLLQRLSSGGGCQIGSLENDFITMTWNGTHDVQSPEETALKSMIRLEEQLKSLKKNSNFPQELNFRIAISSQSCKCGNIGTKEMKSFSILGPYKQNLEKLVKFGTNLDVQLLVMEKIFAKCSQIYHFRCIGWSGNELEFDGIPPGVAIYQVGSALQVESDEW